MSEDFSRRVRTLAASPTTRTCAARRPPCSARSAPTWPWSSARRLADLLPEPYALPLTQTDEVAHARGDGRVLRAVEQLPMELRELLETAVKEASAAQAMAGGPLEPDAPNVAGSDRPLR